MSILGQLGALGSLGWSTGNNSLAQQAIAILCKYGSSAHAWIPGIDTVSGLVCGNSNDGSPSVVDGGVGLVLDAMGNGINPTQALSTARPTLRNTSGYYWWEYDGVDDVMVATFPVGNDNCTIIDAQKNIGVTVETGRKLTGMYNPSNYSSGMVIINGALSADETTVLKNYAKTLSGTDQSVVDGAWVFGVNGTSYVGRGGTVTGGAAVSWKFGSGIEKTTMFADTVTTKKIEKLTFSISDPSKLTIFYCNSNQLTGSIPSLTANTALTLFYCYSNQLTGSIPSLTANTALTIFYCHVNQLTGSIPSLTANTALIQFACQSNQLTGSIPSLTANTALTIFYCHINKLTGSIPSLTANTALTIFYCYSNQLTGYAGGLVSNTLGDFEAQNNLLTVSAVNALLSAFVAANRTTGTRTLNLGGTGNAAPTGQGITDKATLISRGWTVTTN